MSSGKLGARFAHRDDTEKSVLGSIIMYGDDVQIEDCNDNIFSNHTYLAIFKIIKELKKEGLPTGMLNVRDVLVSRGLFGEGMVDNAMLIDITSSALQPYEFSQGTGVLKGLERKREIQEIVEKIQMDTEKSSSSLLGYAEELIRVASVGGDKTHSVSADDVDKLYEEICEKMGKELFGYSWGDNLKFLDKSTRGIQGGVTYRIGAASNVGKAMPLYEKVLTPNGFVEIGSLKVGDEIINSDGGISNVSGVFPQGKKKVHKFHFSDGTSVDSCENHLWKVYNPDWRKGDGSKVLEVKDILSYGLKHKKNKGNRFSVPIPKPIEFNRNINLNINPYVLGIILAEGNIGRSHIQITNDNLDVKERVRTNLAEGDSLSVYSGRTITYGIVGHNTFKELDKYGLKLHRSYEKFIPREFLYSSIDERKQLLEGLIDGDGWIDDSSYVYATSSKVLSEQVEFLARSLGGLVSTSERTPTFSYKGEKKKGRVSYSVRISLPFKLNCSVSYKNNIKDRSRKLIKKIVDYTYLGELECVCISVTSDDKLYVTSGFVLTHNTQLVYNVINSLMKQGAKVAFFTLENRKSVTLTYVLANYQRTSSRLIESGEMNGQYEYLVSLKDKLYIVEDLYDIDSIFTKTLEIKPDIVILDYIGLTEIKKVGEEAKYAEYAKKVQQFVKRSGVAWIDLSNLPRDLQSAENIRTSPQFYGSTFLRNNTDVGIHLYYNKELYEQREAVMEMAEPDSQSTLIWKDKQFINLFISKNRLGTVGLEQTFKVDFSKGGLFLELPQQEKNLLLGR